MPRSLLRKPTHEKLMIKFYYLKQHACVVVDLRLWEHIKGKWSAHILFCRVVPVKRAYSELKSHELLAGEADLLIPFLDGVIVMWFVVQGCRVTYIAQGEFA